MSEPRDVTILVVDDNDVKRYGVVRILRQAGFRILEAATGEEALYMATQCPDLMVLDVKLPGISGFEVCRRIKADPLLKNIKILHVSATYIDSGHRVEGLTHGADGYLVQPVEPGELVETVKALLRLREAEEATRRTARQWRATFDALGNGILLVDERETMQRCNRAMAGIIGKSFHDIIGAPCCDVLSPALLALLEPLLKESVASCASPREITYESRQYQVTVNQVLDEDGRATDAVCVFTDITELKQLQEELRRRADALAQADRAKDEFLAMLGHELRNPLGAISNALEVLRIQDTDSASAPGGLSPARAREILDRQVSTMTRLVDDLLDVSRVTRGKIDLRRETVILDEVVGSVLRNLRPQMEAKGLRLRFETNGAMVVSADRVRLEQVVTNLIGNAIRYTDEGSISVSLRREGQNAVLKVRDTGVGIRSDALLRVFEMFTQGDRDEIRSQGGLGIGLTLVRGLVEQHGGTVEAESDGEGQGSTFTVTLPLLETVPTQEKHAPPDAAMASSRRVLVVDDNVDAAVTMADILTSWGHSAVTAFDGPSALEAVRSECPEVVLLDIGLPGMNGYEVVRQLRQVPQGNKLILVAMTGYGQTEDRRRAVAAGFDYHLAKPVDLPALQQILAHVTVSSTL